MNEIEIEYCPSLDVKRSLSRIWEGDEESECRHTDSQEYFDDDVSSESSLDDEMMTPSVKMGGLRNSAQHY